MEIRWIYNYAGTWEDDESRTLIITQRGETIADVTLLVDGRPMLRPWCRNKPEENLRATYSPADGPGLDIELGRPGFSLDVNYEFVDSILPEKTKVCRSEFHDMNQTLRRRRLFGYLGNSKDTEE